MGELAKALVAAQAVMPSVPKTSTNPHYKSKFASLDDIIEKTRPVLNEHGLSIHQFPSVSELGAPTLVTVLSHVSGERLEYAAPLFLQGQDMQKYGAALTYARRYAWAAALGIANDEDDDGNAASTSTKARATTNGTKTADDSAKAERLRSRIVEIAGDAADQVREQVLLSFGTPLDGLSEQELVSVGQDLRMWVEGGCQGDFKVVPF